MNDLLSNPQAVDRLASVPMGLVAPASPASATAIRRAIFAAVGPAIAILTAWLCSLPQESETNGFTIANVALVMAVVTIGFALMDSTAGVTTSIAAALSLNYFHTEPYRTLRITDRRDLYSVLLLGVLGLAVSSITELRVRRNIRTVEHQRADRSGLELAALLSDPQPAEAVWKAAIAGSSGDMALLHAQVTHTVPRDLPVVRRRYVDGDDPMFGLPTSGAALKLISGSADPESWLIITPRPGLGALEIDRRVVMAFADTVELGLRDRATDELGPALQTN